MALLVQAVPVDDLDDQPVDFDPSVGRDLYGQDPAAYALGRPQYPERVYEVLAERCQLRRGSRVLEIGPGTGLVTRRLVHAGATVTAVEPNEQLARFVRRELPMIETIEMSFETAVLPEAAFDLGVAATSFHWVSEEFGLRKLRRLIRAGGWVAIWWTLFEDPTAPDDFAKAAERVLGPSPAIFEAGRRIPMQIDAAARCAALRDAGFIEVRSELMHTIVTFDAHALRRLYATMAVVLKHPDAERRALLDALEALVRDDFDGEVARPFVTAVYTARVPAPGSVIATT